ncbi:PAS-domain containing protein [uncultured Litoreibacter sp.]|uniref:hybrid sensor histidine kinase/response regulator n=1 Tax=uncultured Litoreibacter sp. TaxID=1392394 RepID=UPI002603E55C|nr:PAS-domain containing protein [uncultured Litoreibacter sp.]
MSLINPADSVERQNEKLLQIAQSLMRRVEQKSEQSGLAYQQFERAALLETQVRERTRELERTLDLLQDSNARLEVANVETETARSNLTEAIETINEGFALFDKDDLLVLFNSRFCRDLVDIDAHLVAGLHFKDYVTLISGSQYLALPDGTRPDGWAAQRMQRHGDAHVVFNVKLLWNRWLQVSEHRTAQGGTVILQTDVTEIIRMERQERDKMRDQQATMLQATLDHLNQGVCIFDHNQILVGWNKKMDGMLAPRGHRAAIGMGFAMLLDRLRDGLQFHEGIDAEHLKKWADHTIRRHPLTFEVSREGRQFFNVFAQDMPDGGFVISFTDVAAERETARALYEMNEQLERRVQDRTRELGVALQEAERANASKSRFIAAASHDLLQPLSAAKLFVSSLPDKVGSADALQVIAKTETALVGAEQIIEALLDISKLDAGKAVFNVHPIGLAQIFAPLRDELTPYALAKGVELRIVDSSLMVNSDPGYLRRIIQNLVSNAIRYTSTGRVLVGVRRIGDFAKIEVWDTGRGISEADQPAIFQEFHRIEASGSDAGLGLGLAIVERACKGLGHDLNLWSQPNVGSCFSVTVALVDSAPQPRVDATQIEQSDLSGLFLMLVENDPQLASAMTIMIEGLGASVIHAATAEDARDLLAEIELVPDAMLLDYHLGTGQTGIEFYAEMSKTHAQVPTAIVSANRSKDLKDACRRMSLCLLEKPINPDRLRSFLSQVPTAS